MNCSGNRKLPANFFEPSEKQQNGQEYSEIMEAA